MNWNFLLNKNDEHKIYAYTYDDLSVTANTQQWFINAAYSSNKHTISNNFLFFLSKKKDIRVFKKIIFVRYTYIRCTYVRQNMRKADFGKHYTRVNVKYLVILWIYWSIFWRHWDKSEEIFLYFVFFLIR